jgi:predicted transcriptional regulator YdeE
MFELGTLGPMSIIGLPWTGSYGEAADGAIKALMGEVRACLGLPQDAPMFGVSWNDRPDGFRHFCGVELSAEQELPAGLARLELESLTCLLGVQEQGDATETYRALMTERDTRGLRPNHDPSMVDEHLSGGRAVRLWLPVQV